MATNRFGYSDDFVLKNGNVGINSSSPQEKLDVVGVVKGQDLKVTGVSSFTTYEGFLNSNQNISENVDLTSGTSGSLSGEIIVGTGVTVTVGSAATSSQGYIDSLKVYNTFTVPTGGTEDRPSKVKPGQLYYNVDFKTIEFWDGNNWRQVDNTTRSGKILFGPGNSGADTSTIDTVRASTLGNATYFGQLSSPRATYGGGGGNEARGLFGGGYNYSNVIDYVTIQSEGNAIDFGDLSKPVFGTNTSCSSTRCVWWLGTTNTPAGGTSLNNIEYVQIATLGNSVDFGDSIDTMSIRSGFASPTRGISCRSKNIEAITLSSLGNSIDIGDCNEGGQSTGCSNSVRGVFGIAKDIGGITINTIEFMTIATTGNSQYFGDLSQGRQGSGSASTQIRGLFAGGNNPGAINIIDYVIISSTGNAIDFGDLSTVKRNSAGISDSHGGLGGF
jgi:hypothetical protein